MYAIQALLYQGAAVLYVGYKSEEMLLFLPGEDGKYRVWRTLSAMFSNTMLKLDSRVVAVIDPPERGAYSARAACRVVMFASNNAKKHFENWEKDGVLLVTSMPLKWEVLAMVIFLWNEVSTPSMWSSHWWQVGKINSLEEKIGEIEKRIDLVGPIPRLVFSSQLFQGAINECLSGAVNAAADVSDSELYKALCGRYSPFIGKHPASVSSRIFFLNSKPRQYRTWRGREIDRITLQLSPLAAHVLQDRLLDRITTLRGLPFEDFAYDVLCERMGLEADTERSGDSSWQDGIRRLVALLRNDDVLFRPGSSNFPLIDFASFITEWYNAKSSNAIAKAVMIKSDGALLFLREMEKAMREVYSRDAIEDIVNSHPPTLTIVCNEDKRASLDKEVDLILFHVPVRVEVLNLRETTSQQVFDNMSTTKKLLKEWDQLRKGLNPQAI